MYLTCGLETHNIKTTMAASCLRPAPTASAQMMTRSPVVSICCSFVASAHDRGRVCCVHRLLNKPSLLPQAGLPRPCSALQRSGCTLQGELVPSLSRASRRLDGASFLLLLKRLASHRCRFHRGIWNVCAPDNPDVRGDLGQRGRNGRTHNNSTAGQRVGRTSDA